MKKKVFIMIPVLLGLFLSACGGGGSESEKLDFENISFESSTYVYDGESHILAEVSGAPEGTNITYTGREEHVDAGTYEASARLVKEGYNDKTLNATLTINPISFGGFTYDDVTVTYDGTDHINDVQLSGLVPEGTTVNETVEDSNGNEATSAIDAGTYEYEVILTKKNYETETLNATLTINPATLSGYTYDDVTVIYDGTDHIGDIQLSGFMPEGTSVEETVKDSSGTVVTVAIEVGVYDYTAVITNKNYETETLTAALTIKALKQDMPVFISDDGTIYFANGLHERFLYSLSSSAELNLIDYSAPKEFNKYSPTTALFISGSVFLNSVKVVSSGTTSILYTDSNIDDFIKLSDSVYYYSSNSLKAAKSGIYKVDATDTENEPIITKVFEGKSDNLAIYGGNLYFTNGNDNNYVYKMNLSSSQTSLVMDEKVHEFTIYNNKLYCTVNGLLNDYIGYLDLLSGNTTPTALTNAAGEFLTVKGGYLYYHYTDLFSVIDESVKGIWRIDLTSGHTAQILANDSVNGFDVESSTSLVYIDTNNLHLYRYNISNGTKVDLLSEFVIPEYTPLNTGGQTISLGTKTYYLNMYADKTLYVYDESTGKNSQLSTNKVEDFYIHNGILYFNQVTLLANNDLYSVNLTSGGLAEKISPNDVRNLVSDGTYLFATHYNFWGVAGGISRMKLDGSDYVKFSETNGATNLITREGKLYFVNNGDIEYINLSSISLQSADLNGTNLSNNIKNVKQFEFEGNNIFYNYNGFVEKSIRRTDFTSLGAGTTIAYQNPTTNPHEFILDGEYVYYYSYPITSLNNAGFYRVSKTAAGDGTQELLVGYQSQYYGSSLSVSSSGNLYFLNYIPPLLGDAHFYQLNLSTKIVSKIS